MTSAPSLRLAVALLAGTAGLAAADLLPYRDPALPTEQRVADLLARMTLEEKAGQMCQLIPPSEVRRSAARAKPQADPETASSVYPGVSAKDVRALTRAGLVGSFLNIPAAAEIQELQDLARQSRLGIPLLIGADAIHGNGLVRGSTIYPAPIGLAATFDEALVERIARQTAIEMRADGANWTFSPNVEIVRDPRWGRTGESFGEDTLLVSRLGVAMVRGYEDRAWPVSERVLSCLKHFVASGAPANGANFAPMDVSERTLREVYLPSYFAGVAAGSGSIMVAHHELNGIPCHANSWIMEDLMRGEARFGGFFVSDWTDVARLETVHHVAANYQDAVALAVSNGLDMNMHGPEFAPALLALVKAGRLTEQRIDASVRRILRTKFELGLFEAAPFDSARRDATLRQPEHRATALEAARKSIVLLKNSGNLLPLDPQRVRRVLVTGPLADTLAIVGDWVNNQPRENIITPLQGIRATAPAGVAIDYADCGDTVRTTPPEKIAAAVARAQDCDAVIAIVGERATRFPEGRDAKSSGENGDRSDIEIFPGQLDLLRQLASTGKPVIAVVVSGRPLALEWPADNLPALLQAWEAGGEGGRAIGEVLFGLVNPSGRLPISVPRGVGHIQSHYNYKPAQYYRPYVVGEHGARYEFGHGLSYTTFRYDNLRTAPQVARDGTVGVAVDVTNTGSRAGDEIVLAFTHDLVASVAMPVRELKAFQRISLAPGETKTVSLSFPVSALALLDRQMKRVVEPGDFELSVGPLTTRFAVQP